MSGKTNNLIQWADKKAIRKKCVIYTRVAETEKMTGNSFEDQENLCREWAKRNNIDVIEVFSDSISRDGLDQMIWFLILMSKEQSHVDFVAVSDITRISRGVWQFSNIKHKIDFFGTQIRSADFDFSSADSILWFGSDMILYCSIDGMINAYNEIVNKRTFRPNKNKDILDEDAI